MILHIVFHQDDDDLEDIELLYLYHLTEDKHYLVFQLMINEYHSVLANIYENLVDRDFKTVTKETQFLIMELVVMIHFHR